MLDMHAKACWLILGAFVYRAELDAVAVLGSMQPHILDYQPVNDNYLQVLSIIPIPTLPLAPAYGSHVSTS